MNKYSPIDGGDGWHVVLRANALSQQPVPDLPREHRRVVPLIIGDRIDDRWRCHLRFRASYDASLEAASLVIPENRQTMFMRN